MSKIDTLLMNLDTASESVSDDYKEYRRGQIPKEIVESRIEVIRTICDNIEEEL